MSSGFKNIDIIPAMQSAVEAIQVGGFPVFRYGHIKEINNIVTKEKKDRYPSVILRLDTTADYTRAKHKYMEYTNVILYIVGYTKESYTASQRKEFVFDAVLTPIYEALIDELGINANFDHSNMIPYVDHRKTDRYFWGSELSPQPTKSVLGDPLDCIELTFDSLLVKNLNC